MEAQTKILFVGNRRQRIDPKLLKEGVPACLAYPHILHTRIRGARVMAIWGVVSRYWCVCQIRQLRYGKHRRVRSSCPKLIPNWPNIALKVEAETKILFVGNRRQTNYPKLLKEGVPACLAHPHLLHTRIRGARVRAIRGKYILCMNYEYSRLHQLWKGKLFTLLLDITDSNNNMIATLFSTV